MELLDAATAIMGAITIINGLTVGYSAFVMPPIHGKMRRALRLGKAALMLYIGVWWVALGLSIPHSAEVSRYWLRPAIFLAFSFLGLAVHHETVAPRLARFIWRRRA